MAKETTDIQHQELDELFERYRQAPDSYVFVVLADSCRKMGRIEEALDVCDQGLEKHPDYASGHVVRGKCLYDLGRQPDARNAFEEVLRLDRSNLVALKFLGMIDAEAGRLDSARSHFERILELDPDNKDIKQALRVVDEKNNAAVREEEVQELDIATAVDDGPEPAPQDADLETSDELASATLADIFADQGYTEKALAIYRELLAQQPGNAAVRAKIAALTGEALEPISSAETAREDDFILDQAQENADESGPAIIIGPPTEETETVAPDDTADDETAGGGTIHLQHDASPPATDAGAPEGPPPEKPWEPKHVTPSPAPVIDNEDDLDASVDSVIMLGADSEEEAPPSAEPPEAADEGDDEVGKTAVVELPYDTVDQDSQAEERQFEEMDDSRPIKRQSPPPAPKGARSHLEDSSSHRHRRSIDEKENFNYFKRWLDRMQD